MRADFQQPEGEPIAANLKEPIKYPPLDEVTTPNVDTAAAAYYLLRRRNTLRVWAMRGHPIKVLRVNGRLAWPVAEIRRLVSGGTQ